MRLAASIPWAPLPSPVTPFIDGLATPVDPNDGGEPSIIDESALDEMSALVNTLSPDTSPTPPNTTPAPPLAGVPSNRRRRRWSAASS